MVRLVLVALLCLGSPIVTAIEVSSIVSCKQEGDHWLCAAYQNDTIQVFRSDYYQTQVEFKGDVSSGNIDTVEPATTPVSDAPVLVTKKSEDGLPSGRYTIQLLACSAVNCEQRMSSLRQVTGSQLVDMKVNDNLLKILIIGGFESYKDAQRAAADLMTRYQIAEKPWIRTIQSVRNNMLKN